MQNFEEPTYEVIRCSVEGCYWFIPTPHPESEGGLERHLRIVQDIAVLHVALKHPAVWGETFPHRNVEEYVSRWTREAIDFATFDSGHDLVAHLESQEFIVRVDT